MGYCQYCERVPELSREGFSKVADDLRLVFPVLKTIGVKLAGPEGVGDPELSESLIAFNGARDCGHRYMDLGHPWPSKTAEGIFQTPDPIGDDEGDKWFNGPYLRTRICGGSCAGKPFIMDRKYLARRWERSEHGMYSQIFETEYKPYDLAVTLALIRFKERCPDEVTLWSDSYQKGFEDALRINREYFGWPKHFEMKAPEPALVFSEES